MSAIVLRNLRRQLQKELPSRHLHVRSMSVLSPSAHLALPTSTQKRCIAYTAPLQQIMQYDGVSESVSKIINEHAQQHQTSVSLQALMKTGRGEYLHKSFDNLDESQHTATELVRIQVS